MGGRGAVAVVQPSDWTMARSFWPTDLFDPSGRDDVRLGLPTDGVLPAPTPTPIFRCERAGEGGYDMAVFLDIEASTGVGRHRVGWVFRGDVTCVEPLPCTASDPVDVGASADGDPALDLVCATTGVTPDGRPWVRVRFDGPWPPASHYSWFARVTLGGAAAGASTGELHDGVFSTIVSGAVTEAGTSYPEETSGLLLVFDAATAGATTVTVESGVLRTAAGTFVPDTIAATPFDATVRAP